MNECCGTTSLRNLKSKMSVAKLFINSDGELKVQVGKYMLLTCKKVIAYSLLSLESPVSCTGPKTCGILYVHCFTSLCAMRGTLHWDSIYSCYYQRIFKRGDKRDREE